MSTKRILSLVLTLTLILGSFSFAFADTAIQPKADLTTEQKIAELVRLGFVKGDELGNLNLDKKITRAETATIVAKAVVSGGEKDMAEVEKEIEKSRYQSRFSDVPADNWANPYINVSVQEGIVKGYPDNSFKPANNITYAEVITMMVNVLGQEPTPGVNWPDNYIGKARALGILEGIDVNYKGEAIRGGVFELLYNTLTENAVGQYNIDKVIVLENNRVESIGANEIVVEVIREIQRANFIKNPTDKAQRGDQMRIVVPTEVGEVEDLLGKVIDLSYDATNKAVRVQLDNTYQYLSGKIALDTKSLTVDEKAYTVLKEEQYQNSDERIFSTYINNEDYTYDKAYKEMPVLDFGRVTIKNGKVLFIDAFAFEDIAPVKEVNKEGKEIVVYNDMNDGGVKTISLDKEKVISFKDGKFTQMNIKDISKLDVLHVSKADSKGNKAVVVREDAIAMGTYEKVTEYKNKTVVVVDGKEYAILDVNYKRPVYSVKANEFRTLYKNSASYDLKGFKNEKVTVLKDINGDLQYIGAEIEFGEFVGLVDKIVGKEARILKGDQSTSDYTATLDTVLETKKINGELTNHQNLNLFNRGDLVFVAADKTQLDAMKILSPVSDDKDITKTSKITKIDPSLRFISVEGRVSDYRVFDRTNIFVRNNNGEYIAATTLANVEKNVRAKITAGTLRAVVISDADYAAKSPRYNYGSDANIAHSIVFIDVDVAKELNYRNAEVTSINNRYEQITVRYSDGTVATLNINKSSEAYKALNGTLITGRVQVGDIVELGTSKTNTDTVENIDRLINVDETGYKVKSYNPNTRVLVLENGMEYFLTTSTDNFIKGSLEAGKEVAVETDAVGSKYVVAIADRTVKAPTEQTQVLQKAVETDGRTILTIDGQLYQYAGPVSDVANFVGKSITFKSQLLNNVNYIYDIKLAVQAPGTVNKTVLANRITEASAKVEANYTTATFGLFKIALDKAKAVNIDANATKADVDTALAALNTADDNLVLAGNVIEAVFTEQIAGNKVTFTMPVGQTAITNAKVNTVATTSFYVDTVKKEGQVRVNAKTDIIVVTIAGIEYNIVAK